MKEIILADCQGKIFQKNEKVLAFNIFKDNKYICTKIEKYKEEKDLNEEFCKKQKIGNISIYNIGAYKVIQQISDYAKIKFWDRLDRN
jgi:hypothetical protein